MPKLFTILVAWALILTPGAGAQTVDAEARARIAVIEARLGIVAAAATQPATQAVVVSPAPSPTPLPAPSPGPAPTSTTVTAKPVTLAALTRTIKQANQIDLNIVANYAGTRYDLGPSGKFVLYGGAKLNNATIGTTPGVKNGAVLLQGDGASIENIVFADKGGYLIEAKGKNQVIRNVSAQTFTDYGIFCTDAQNITITKLYIKGGPTVMSAVRFSTDKVDFCSGILSDFVIDWTTGSGSAAIRGNFVGVIENGLIRGRVVGLNPQDNDDEGMADCIYIFWVNGMPTKAANIPECLAAVKAARARSITDPLALCKAAMAVARDGAGKPIAGDAAQSVAMRKRRLARRSDVIFRAVTFDNAPLRWAAGTKYTVNNCTFIGPTIFDKPTLVYPTPELLEPGDLPRPAPDITFTSCEFKSPMTKADFLEACQRYGAKVRLCTFNGEAINQ